MSTTITGKLNKDASEFAAGESTGFGVRLGVQYYDRETQQKEWTNYEGAIFAKAPAQINFYRDILREGAIIEVSCDQLKIKSFDGQNGTMLSLEMLNAKLGYAHNPNQQQGQPQQNMQQPAQGGYAQQPQQPQQPMQQPSQGYANQSGGAPQQRPAQQHAQPHQMAQQPQNQFAQEDDIPF
tara:strand:+ start:2653 stop:3195 length:543 start_codon:yes stop_codon:yes gene_type:complete